MVKFILIIQDVYFVSLKSHKQCILKWPKEGFLRQEIASVLSLKRRGMSRRFQVVVQQCVNKDGGTKMWKPRRNL